jgi:hypothetical protein
MESSDADVCRNGRQRQAEGGGRLSEAAKIVLRAWPHAGRAANFQCNASAT